MSDVSAYCVDTSPAPYRARTDGAPTRDQTLAESAYERLRRQLITCTIQPGTTFTESEAAQWLQLGKTPTREALLRVRLEGLVRVQPRAGYSAAPATLKDARDVCAFRVLLEGDAATYLAAEHPELGARRLSELDTAMTMSAQVAPDQDQAAMIEADHAFHVELGRLTGNEHLLHALDNVLVHFSRLLYLSLALDRNLVLMRHTHADLIGAISAGNGARARDLAAEEVRRAEHMIVEVFICSHSVASANISVAASTNRFYLNVPKETKLTPDSEGTST